MTNKWFFLMLLYCLLHRNSCQHDITQDPEFGCHWGGGYETGVTCSCKSNTKEFFIQNSDIPRYDAVEIKITNCDRVRFAENSIYDIRNLRRLYLININSLYLENNALHWNAYVKTTDDRDYFPFHNTPNLRIFIDNSKIVKISSYTFKGEYNSIIINNTLIEDVNSFAFSSLIHNELIHFHNVNFTSLKPQSFKNIITRELILSNSTFDILPSRLFTDVSVLNNFKIINCDFNLIKSGSFYIQNPRQFEISDCVVNLLEGDAFKVTTKGSVLIRRNIFNVTNNGAFNGISLNTDEILNKEKIWFDSNVFYELERKSLNINSSSFSVKFSNNLINQSCDCTNYEFQNNDNEEEFYCTFNGRQKIVLKEFQKDKCNNFNDQPATFIIVAVVVVIAILITTGLIFYVRKNCTKDQKYSTNTNGKPLRLVVPDGRTYRETELHIVVERADLLTTNL